MLYRGSIPKVQQEIVAELIAAADITDQGLTPLEASEVVTAFATAAASSLKLDLQRWSGVPALGLVKAGLHPGATSGSMHHRASSAADAITGFNRHH